MIDPFIALWTSAIILFIVTEAVTASLLTIWFALGSLAALIVVWLGGNLTLQIIAFIVVSAISLYLLFPLAKKHFNTKKEATNADRVIGKQGIVTETINETLGKGQVKVLGNVWSARSETGEIIEENTFVTITKIEGVKLVVKKL